MLKVIPILIPYEIHTENPTETYINPLETPQNPPQKPTCGNTLRLKVIPIPYGNTVSTDSHSHDIPGGMPNFRDGIPSQKLGTFTVPSRRLSVLTRPVPEIRHTHPGKIPAPGRLLRALESRVALLDVSVW